MSLDDVCEKTQTFMKKSAGKAENEGGGSSGSNEDHGSSSNLDSSPKKSLPYNGSLQEAIKQQDREAVKYLMSLRQQQQPNNTIYPSNNDENESKHDLPESTSLQNCLLSLGFSSIQLHEYFHCDDDENNYQDDEYQKIIQSEALKTIFDSEKHFPNPTNKKLSKVSSPSSQDLSWNDEQHHVNPQMLRGLDPESTWTLLQCCVNHPTISQIQIYEILTQLNSLSAICLINQTTCKWLHNVLIKGYIMEVKCILFNLYLLLQTDAYSSSPRTDQTCSDQLLMSYMCPITREILVEPVTLQVIAMIYIH